MHRIGKKLFDIKTPTHPLYTFFEYINSVFIATCKKGKSLLNLSWKNYRNLKMVNKNSNSLLLIDKKTYEYFVNRAFGSTWRRCWFRPPQKGTPTLPGRLFVWIIASGNKPSHFLFVKNNLYSCFVGAK